MAPSKKEELEQRSGELKQRNWALRLWGLYHKKRAEEEPQTTVKGRDFRSKRNLGFGFLGLERDRGREERERD